MGTQLTGFQRDMVAAAELCRAAELFVTAASGWMVRMDMEAGREGPDAYSHDLAQMMLQLRQIADGLDNYLKEFFDE